MPEILECQRSLFSIPSDVSYLNCAFFSPALNSQAEMGKKSIEFKQHPWTIDGEEAFFNLPDKCRNEFAKIIADDSKNIAIVPSASYGINLAAVNLPVSAGQDIILLDEQFPSNVYAWQELAKRKNLNIKTISKPAEGSWNEHILDSITSNTAIVSIPHSHWTDGCAIDLKAIGVKARQHNAALVVDATQSLGAKPFSISEIQPDFLIAASYKWLLGPYGVTFVYMNPKWQQGSPIEFNWISRKDSDQLNALTQYTDQLRDGAKGFDAGHSANILLLPMALAALEQINSWGVDNISASLAAYTTEICKRASELPNVSVLDAKERSPHFCGIRYDHGIDEKLIERLQSENIHISVRGSSLRISPHLYNDQNDLDRLFSVLES